MGKSSTRPTWTYKLGQNIILIEKVENDLRVVIRDNLLSDKHIDRIFGETFMISKKYMQGFSLPR